MTTSRSDSKSARARAAQRTTAKAKAAAKSSAKATAAEATRRARNAGAKGPAHRGQMSKHQMRMRNSAVVASMMAGESPVVIAERWGITQRSVERITKAAQENPVLSPLAIAPTDLLEEVLFAYRQQVVDAAMSAVEYAEKHPAASIAAQRLRGEAWRAYLELLTQVGKLPSNLELFRSESEMMDILNGVVDRIAGIEAGTQDLAEFREWAESVMGTPPARQQFDVEAQALPERAA